MDRLARVVLERSAFLLGRLAPLGDAPVHQHDLAEAADHHVRGLDVAVDVAVRVRELRARGGAR